MEPKEEEQYYDHQNCKINSGIVSQLSNDERIIFSILVEKKRWMINQERTLLVTNHFIYNVDEKDIKRKLRIQDLHALTEGPDCGEFILHVLGDYDYRFISNQQKLIFEVIEYAYANSTQKCLPIYKVPGKVKELEKYTTSKDQARLKKDMLPPDEFRV